MEFCSLHAPSNTVLFCISLITLAAHRERRRGSPCTDEVSTRHRYLTVMEVMLHIFSVVMVVSFDELVSAPRYCYFLTYRCQKISYFVGRCYAWTDSQIYKAPRVEGGAAQIQTECLDVIDITL